MKKLWDIIIGSFSGGERDYTSMGVRRAILLLSIPMVLEMGMEATFAIVDAFFVAKLGTASVATVGLTESLLVAVYSIAWGLGIGATAVVARRTGEKDAIGAREAAGQSVLIALVIGSLLALPGMVFAPELLGLMGASGDTIHEGSSYARIMFASNIVIMLLFCINAVFRGKGFASMALWTLGLANLVNIILDPILIFGLGPFPEMGVTGAAVATTIGRTVGVLFQLYHLFRKNGAYALSFPDLRPLWNVVWNILKVSTGSIGQFLIASASWTFLVRIVSESGTDAQAGYTIAVRIIIFTLLPGWGMANAAATLVGQNLGAGQADRAARSAWLCAHYNMVFMVVVAVIFWLFAPWIVSLFAQNTVADAYAVQALRVICLGYFFYGYGMVLAQAFNGAGDSLTPTLMNVVCFWMIEIPVAYVLAKTLGWGPLGVFASVAIGESALAVLSAVLFQRGKWKTVKV
ncbi:MAG: MATE family efflux transporter [Flavobacteriales bacterium]|nr:MATE family efflux transporter [Flavobacteriales bacterium]